MPATLIQILAARFRCDVCGCEVRIDATLVEDLNQAANDWIGGHLAPRLLAVEEETDGVEYEWVPV